MSRNNQEALKNGESDDPSKLTMRRRVEGRVIDSNDSLKEEIEGKVRQRNLVSWISFLCVGSCCFFFLVCAIALTIYFYHEFKTDSPDILEEYARDVDTVFIDVRTEGEVEESSIPVSINIPLHEISESHPSLPSKSEETKIIVFCKSGHRSGLAKKLLESYGYEYVINGGGLEDMKSLLGL